MAEAKVPDEVDYDPYKLLLYKKAIRKGKERENTLRINIIGNYAQGKTSLANRLMGKTCEGVTTTNGIEINRYRCQTFNDGSHTFKSFENENQDFLNRVATVARSIEQTIRLNTDETNLEENATVARSTRRAETPQDQNQTLETKLHIHTEPVASNPDGVEDFFQPVPLQIPEIKEKKTKALSHEEMATFSNVVEVQKDELAKFIDIWDFGGQYIFYATHTLFHSRRALYLLVFDLTKSLDTIVMDEEFPGETGDRNMEYFARFWLESIHAYTGPGPQVILVGTHKDKLRGNDRLWNEYFEKVRRLFDDTELIRHIQKEDFAVDNNDMSDPVIAELIEFILKKHQELVQHVEIPARWIQLEKSLRALKTSIVSFQDVIELDKRNEYPLHDEEQLKLFLHYHHEKGSLFFYDEDQLSDSICLDPKFLVDAFKCIITSEHFFKNDPDVRSLRTTLSKEGRLSHQLIDLVWSNKSDFVKHKDVILGFLKKQNILAEVVEYNEQSGEKKQKDWFIVPSLLKDHSSNEEMVNFLARKPQSKVRYALKFDKSSIVNQMFHKVSAASLGKWPVVKCGTKQLLFENLCVFQLTRHHAGLLEQRKESGTIELRVIRLQQKQVESQAADEFRRFVESIVLHEFRRLKFQKEEDKPFVPAYRCNHVDHGLEGSSQLSDFKQNEDVICPDNITHENFDDERAKKEWLTEYMIDEEYPAMHLTEKALSNLAQAAIGANWRLLGPQLKVGIAEIDHIEDQHKRIEMQIYSMLLKWKGRSADKATLDELVKAIQKCPGVSIDWDEIKNIRDEYLRKQKKQETDVTRPLSNKTVTVNDSLTLECEINKPNVSVTWLKDGVPITQGGRKTMSSNGGLHKLIVEDVTVEDAAKYTCAYGNSTTECFVKIEDTDGPLKFIKELSDIEVGDIPCTITFTCELNTSQTEVEWYYRNQRLYPSNKYRVIDDGSTHMLKITDVSEKDEGKYSALANGVRSEASLYVEVRKHVTWSKEINYFYVSKEETEEERYLLAQHRKRQRAYDSEHLKSHTQLRSDSGVSSTQTNLNNSHVWSVESEQSYTIKAEGDSVDCYITGCCMLPTGEILLADYNNRRLKKLNDRYQVISVCDLPGPHRDVCYCGNNKAVLAMFNSLQFVDVTGGMSLTRSVRTDHLCSGLTCHGNQLYVTDRKSVYIYSTGGIKQHVLYTHHSGDTFFFHIAASDDGNYIYIADLHKGLHTIDSVGNHLYTFTDTELDGACDVCIDGEGHVLVGQYWSNKVVQFSSDGKQKLGIIVDKIDNEYSIHTIYFNRGNATLIVAGVSNKINVFKLK